MYIVATVADLIFQSRIEAAARRVRVAVQCVRTPAEALGQLGAAVALVVDMTLAPGDPVTLIGDARARRTELPIVAFLPHVATAQAAQARAAGANEVVPRGQFDAQLDAILQRLSASAGC